ncbi:MAG TPA: pitrilysin family protein [Ktedonobacteraceae bacterium]|nr:pitrilysin family protein [Ktedonobacteraceae bacterium]
MQYQRTTLQNGLRLLTAPMQGMRSASIALIFTVGSRFETQAQAGISHFIEHMLFKGSQQYPTARHISEAIEGVGGVFNGSTDKELTIYTARVPGEQLPTVMEVLADMVRRPLFDALELEKERSVIIEELSSTRDDPQEWVSLLIDEIMWPGLPLGRDDAGFVETVTRIQQQDMLGYLNEYYRPNSLIISVAGNINSVQIIDLTERLFGDWEAMPRKNWVESFPPQDAVPVAVIQKDTEQANVCLGTLGIAYTSPDYYAFMLTNAILGEGMSSRLFQSIREEQGLAYDIGSYFNSYAETGNFVVSAGVDPAQIEPAIRAIICELSRISQQPVPADELNRIKAYIRGSIILGLEGTAQVASWLGSQEYSRGMVLPVDEIVAKIDAVTANDIQRIAQRCFAPEWRRLAVIGPYNSGSAERFAKMLKGAD